MMNAHHNNYDSYDYFTTIYPLRNCNICSKEHYIAIVTYIVSAIIYCHEEYNILSIITYIQCQDNNLHNTYSIHASIHHMHTHTYIHTV